MKRFLLDFKEEMREAATGFDENEPNVIVLSLLLIAVVVFFLAIAAMGVGLGLGLFAAFAFSPLLGGTLCLLILGFSLFVKWVAS